MLDNELVERPQTIADRLKKRAASIPLTQKTQLDEAVVILSDISGSMSSTCNNGQSKLKNVKQSIPFLYSPGNYIQYSLIGFGSHVKGIVPQTTNFQLINSGIDQLFDGGGTSMCQGLYDAIQLLNEPIAQKKRIILLTDGHSTDGNPQDLAIQCKSKGIIIDTIAFGSDADVNLLKWMASETGGLFTLAESPLQLQQTYQKLNYSVRYITHKI